MTNQTLAEKINLSASPCLRRLRILEESGVIRGYSANIDPKKYGLTVTAFVSVRLERHSKEAIANFEKRVKDLNEVVGCYLLTGAQDYLLHVFAVDLDSYDDFIRNRLHRIDGIGSIDSSISYSTIKQTGVFPDID